MRWFSSRAASGRMPQHNIFTTRSGFRIGLHPESRKESFLSLCEDIIDITVRFTNLHGRRINRNNILQWRPTDREEMEAFIGLHFLAGSFKAHHRQARELWSERDGHPLFRATMSYERFAQLKGVLRFDDKLRRDTNDKLAPVRQIVEIFNTRLQEVYTPGPFLVIDEMLIEFHGRVAFKQYIPTKPGKFGIKVFWVVDNENTVPLSCLFYIGQSTIPEEEMNESDSVAEAQTLKLVKPFLGKGRNVTADNYFISVPLARRLLANKTTLVGTIRKNKRDLPQAAKSTTHRKKKNSLHFYADDLTLCSFWDEGSSPVLLLSTMHASQEN